MSLIILCIVSIILMLIAIRKGYGPMGRKSRRPDYTKIHSASWDYPLDESLAEPGIMPPPGVREVEQVYDNTAWGPAVLDAPIINKGKIMGKISAFLLGFMLASFLGSMTTLSYFLFCPHAKHRTIIITPPELIPNPMLPEIPKGPSPLLIPNPEERIPHVPED